MTSTLSSPLGSLEKCSSLSSVKVIVEGEGPECSNDANYFQEHLIIVVEPVMVD